MIEFINSKMSKLITKKAKTSVTFHDFFFILLTNTGTLVKWFAHLIQLIQCNTYTKSLNVSNVFDSISLLFDLNAICLL